ncbi:MAG: IS630 family transposase [Planctomycetota bacterium]
MPRMVSGKRPTVKTALRRMLKKTNDKRLSIRIRIVLMNFGGQKASMIADSVGCSDKTVRRWVDRFTEEGIAGLHDRREDNGDLKLDEAYLGRLKEIVDLTPREFGYDRPTWTRELLVEVMKGETNTRIHPATMSRALKKIKARRGRPRPIVGCPWSKHAKTRRINQLKRLQENLKPGEILVYEDEVDIHLNPKLGLDWMNHGTQKEVLTPGQNKKRYLAGAVNAVTGELTVVEGDRKNSDLFLKLLEKLQQKYPMAKKIYVILDNYRIHSSKIVNAALDHHLKQIKLEFLPPYCPNENRIERIWKDLHDQVTRNHRHPDLKELMKDVRKFVKRYNRKRKRIYQTQLAA